MKFAGSRTRDRSRHDADDAPDVPDEPPVGASAGQVATAKLATGATTVALYCCLAAGPLALAVGVLALGQAAAGTPVVAATVQDTAAHDRAAEFGLRVVRTWLTATRGDADALTALVPAADVAALGTAAPEVGDLTVAQALQQDGLWAVTVAADVTSGDVTTHRYFRVSVVVGDGTVGVMALPAEVAAPVVTAPGASAYTEDVALDDGVTGTVQDFLTAYLAGTGDVTRFVTPGVDITALAPAPYTQVTVDAVAASTEVPATPADGATVHVEVHATGASGQDTSLPLVYDLTLTARDGRWEVAAIDVTPQVPTADATGGTATLDPVDDATDPVATGTTATDGTTDGATATDGGTAGPTATGGATTTKTRKPSGGATTAGRQ